MWRIWPADVEQILQVDGVSCAGFYQPLAVAFADIEFRASEKPRADPRARRAQRQRGGQTAAVADPSRRNHRHR